MAEQTSWCLRVWLDLKGRQAQDAMDVVQMWRYRSDSYFTPDCLSHEPWPYRPARASGSTTVEWSVWLLIKACRWIIVPFRVVAHPCSSNVKVATIFWKHDLFDLALFIHLILESFKHMIPKQAQRTSPKKKVVVWSTYSWRKWCTDKNGLRTSRVWRWTGSRQGRKRERKKRWWRTGRGWWWKGFCEREGTS